MADKTRRDLARQAPEGEKRLARMGIKVKLRPPAVPAPPRDPDERWRGEDLAPYLEVLRERLQALALPADAQLRLFPGFVPTAEELWMMYAELESSGSPRRRASTTASTRWWRPWTPS